MKMGKVLEVLKPLTVDDFKSHTWDYSDEDVLGIFNGQLVCSYLWEVLDINPFPVRRCNLSEGWIEMFEVEGNPKSVKDMKLVINEKGDLVIKRQDYTGRLSILNTTGEEILQLKIGEEIDEC